jgi:hypothetical protein
MGIVHGKRDPINKVLTSQLVDRERRGIFMTEPADDTVWQRLVRLERTVRRWRMIGCGLLAVLGLALLLGAAGRKDLKAAEDVLARHFILMGRGPRPLGSFLVGKEGTPSLLLFDQQGAVRAGISILDGGRPSLGLLDAQGQSRLVLTLEPNGTPVMRLLDAQGQVIWSAP